MKKWQIAGFIFTGVLGVILHFLYDWTGSLFVAPISAVNESTFEHLKLLFFPMFAFAFIENMHIGKVYGNFWCIKLIGIMLSIILTPVLFYTINGAFGPTPDWINIAIFFVASGIGYLTETWLFKCCIKCKSLQKALWLLWIVAISFIVFTFVQPNIPLFQDPITGLYGV